LFDLPSSDYMVQVEALEALTSISNIM
jgi:hypothetical protein